MRKTFIAFITTTMVIFAASAAVGQQTIRIGVILAYSGPFADPSTQMDNGIKLYMLQHGDTVAGKKIELIRKDTGGVAPLRAKELAQDLITRDNVDLFAGFLLTPNALGVADISAQASKFMVNMNAAAATITTKSPYMVRTSLTVPQLNETFGMWAHSNGVRTVYTMVADFGPGHEAEAAFQYGYKSSGGDVVGSVHYPLGNQDLSAFVQQARDSKADAIYMWPLGGPQSAAIGKAIASRGVDPSIIKILGPGQLTSEDALKSMGDVAIGIITASHYDFNHPSDMNASFVRSYNEAFGRNPDMFSVGAYDGMHVIYEALKKTKGNTGGESLVAGASKDMRWESPRGMIAIDPETRDVVQTIYIRRVQRVGGELRNIEFDKIADVKDPFKARMKH